jgi:DNA-binding CsgD family transcriptional regulator
VGYRPAIPVTQERSVLTLVGAVMALLDIDELCQGLLVAVREAVPAQWCAMNEVPADVPDAISLTDPPVPSEMHDQWVRYGPQNPLVEYFQRTRDGRATRWSDVITPSEMHRLEVYTEIYRPLGVEYQIAFSLPSLSTRILGVALSRSSRDFTLAERDLLNLARPYLIQAYRNALSYRRDTGPGRSSAVADLVGLGLTRRQAEVLRLVAMGQSDRDVADTLGIGVRTVEKHLENAYRALGVDNRSHAARLAWEATSG